MKKTNLLLLTLALPLLLAGCASGNNGSSADSVASIDSDEGLTSLDSSYNASVKNYLKTLVKAHNYTISEEVGTDDSNEKNSLTLYYGKDFYYEESDYSACYGYIKCSDGVYRIHESNSGNVGGELFLSDEGTPIKTLWNDLFFYSFADLAEEDIDAIKTDGKENVSITGKKNRLALLNLFGLGTSYYMNIVSFTASIKNSGNLSFSLKVKSDTTGDTNILVKAEVTNLLKTSCSAIENYRANQTYFVIDNDFAKVRSLMRGNNYTHYYYDESDGSKVVGTEYFNEDYYFGDWESDYASKAARDGTAILYSQGLIGIKNKKMEDPSTGIVHSLNGSYLITKTTSGLQVNLSNYYNESPNIPVVYSYPSLMEMWDEVELFSEVSSEDLAAINSPDRAFVTDDATLISNFVSMFFLTSNVASVACENLYVGWKGLSSSEDTMIRFTLETSGGSLSYEFYEFGTTSIETLEEFMEELQD